MYFAIGVLQHANAFVYAESFPVYSFSQQVSQNKHLSYYIYKECKTQKWMQE